MEIDIGDGCRTLQILNATKLYTWKWLKWQFLCSRYFTTISKKYKSKGGFNQQSRLTHRADWEFSLPIKPVGNTQGVIDFDPG